MKKTSPKKPSSKKTKASKSVTKTTTVAPSTPPVSPTPSPQTDSVNPVPPEQVDPLLNPKKKIWKSVAGVVVALIALGAIGYWAYANFFVGPEAALVRAMQGMVGIDSVRITMDIPEADLSMESKIHTNKDALSEFSIVYNGEEIGQNETLKFKIIAGMKDAYIQMDYTSMDKILKDLTLELPEIVSMQTYSLLRPVLTGGSWLRFDNPDFDESDESEKQEFSEEEEEFFTALKNSVIYNEFDRNYKMDGKKYRRITIGFDKEKLLEAVDLLKDTDLDAKLSQINALEQAIEDINDWDEDLIEILINDQDKLSQVKVSLPEISEEAIQDAIETSMEDSEGGLAATGGAFGATQLESFFTKFIPSKEESNLTHFFTMSFDQYDQVEEVERPGNVVEFDTVLQYAQVELMPFVYQYMMMQQQPSKNMMPGIPPGMGSGYPGMDGSYQDETIPSYPGSSLGKPPGF